MLASTGSPSSIYPSTHEERGTEPRSSGRICSEEVGGVNAALKKFDYCRAVGGSCDHTWPYKGLFEMLLLEQEYTGSALGRAREHWQS